MVRSLQSIYRELTFSGPALLFDVTSITPNASGPSITLALTGNDPLDVLTPYEHPRPLSGGFFFGYFDNLIERRGCKLSGVPIGGDPTAYAEFELTDHVMALEGKAAFTDSLNVRNALRFPITSPQSGIFQQNRTAAVTSRSLLVVRLDKNKLIREYVEAHYYPNCGVQPTDEFLSVKEPEPLDFYALVGQSLDDDGCLTTKFDKYWFVALGSDGENTLVTS